MLLPVLQHSWELSPQEAVTLQRELMEKVDPHDARDHYDLIAGVDVGIKGARRFSSPSSEPNEIARAAVVVLTFPELEIVERVVAERPITFPYIPGLLSFREIPVILDALSQIRSTPDVLMVDGQGIAHPRRLGIAAHLGLVLDHPAIGCAKSRLSGRYEEPGEERGSTRWLLDRGEIIGAVVRTRTRVKPLFVSLGHKISLETAIDLVLRSGRGYRLPEPTRWAHHTASVTS